MKKFPRMFFVIPVMTLFLAGTGSVFAATPTQGGPTKVSTVTSVNAGANTITINTGATNKIKNDTGGPHDTLTYKIDFMTAITVNGLKGTLADIKVGMKVDITRGMDRDVAATITAYGAPPALAGTSPAKAANGKAKGPIMLGQKIKEQKIISVGADSITVGAEGTKQLRAFQIGKSTQILVNGEKAELGALRPGMKVEYRVGGDQVLESVTASK